LPLCKKCKLHFEGDRCPQCRTLSARASKNFNKALNKPIFFLLAGAAAALIAGRIYPPLDRERILVLAVVLVVAPILAHIVSYARRRKPADPALPKKAYSWSAVSLTALALAVFLNGAGDRLPARNVQAGVLHKYVYRGRGMSYSLAVSSWRPGHNEESLHVSAGTFRRVREGEPVTVEVHAGLLGLPWYGKISPLKANAYPISR
jgi:hypothetical protein